MDVTARGRGPLPCLVRSDLQGLALQLPAPLDKDSAQRLPQMVRSTHQGAAPSELDIVVQGRGSCATSWAAMARPKGARLPWARMSAATAQHHGGPQRGRPWCGFPRLDIDAWSQVLDTLEGSDGHKRQLPAPAGATGRSAACAWPSATWAPSSAQLAYQPQPLARPTAGRSSLPGMWNTTAPSEQHPAGLGSAQLERFRNPRL